MHEETAKEKVLKFYPDAKAIYYETRKMWKISSGDKIIGGSFLSENIAWGWALSRANMELLHTLGG